MKTTMIAILVVAGLMACTTTHVDPKQAAEQVAVQLAAGDVAKAEESFRALGDGDDRAAAFPYLFARGREMAEQRDYATCIRVNRFLVAHYPGRVGAREALLFALMLERARSGEAHDAATRKEMIAQSAAIRKSQEAPPPWVDLALAQAAIDLGDLDGARVAMTRFHARWNGHPASLMDYALELDRWLASHAAP